MTTQRVSCVACGATLGEWVADVFIMRYRGRELVCREPVSLRCEQCRAVTTPVRPGPDAGAAGAGCGPGRAGPSTLRG